MENKPRNLTIENIHKIISELRSKTDEYTDILAYVTGIEDRLSFICKQNAVYKERCTELTKALEDMVVEHCSHTDHLDHRYIKANQEAFKVLGIKNCISIDSLEKLLKRKLK